MLCRFINSFCAFSKIQQIFIFVLVYRSLFIHILEMNMLYIGCKLFGKLFQQNGRHPWGITPNNQQLVVPTTVKLYSVINLINGNIKKQKEHGYNIILFSFIIVMGFDLLSSKRWFSCKFFTSDKLTTMNIPNKNIS